MKKSLIAIFAHFTVLICISIAEGQIVTFSYEGIIDTIDYNYNDAIPGLHLGQQFSGWFQYEIIPDQYAESYLGRYNQDASIVFDLGDFNISYLDDFVYIRVLDGNTGSSSYPDRDEFDFAVDGLHGDYSFGNFGLELIDNSEEVFYSDALPTWLNLSELDEPRFLLIGNKSGDAFNAEGYLTELTLVPEPGTVLLLGLGVLGVFGRSRH